MLRVALVKVVRQHLRALATLEAFYLRHNTKELLNPTALTEFLANFSMDPTNPKKIEKGIPSTEILMTQQNNNLKKMVNEKKNKLIRDLLSKISGSKMNNIPQKTKNELLIRHKKIIAQIKEVVPNNINAQKKLKKHLSAIIQLEQKIQQKKEARSAKKAATIIRQTARKEQAKQVARETKQAKKVARNAEAREKEEQKAARRLETKERKNFIEKERQEKRDERKLKRAAIIIQKKYKKFRKQKLRTQKARDTELKKIKGDIRKAMKVAQALNKAKKQKKRVVKAIAITS